MTEASSSRPDPMPAATAAELDTLLWPRRRVLAGAAAVAGASLSWPLAAQVVDKSTLAIA